MRSILSIFLIGFPFFALGQNTETESLKYLGEKRPGKVPVKFAPHIVSLEEQREFCSTFSRDGKEFFFAVLVDGRAETRSMKLSKTNWTKPKTILSDPVFNFNDAMLSPDGNKLFFISDRPLDYKNEKKDFDIWYVERNGGGWSAPINAGPAINSDKNEYYVSFAQNGTMYYSSNRKFAPGSAGDYDICTSPFKQGKFQNAMPLGNSINTSEYEADVFVAPDESYVIFCAVRTEGYGAGDLYISFKNSDGTWTKAKNMGETINTPGHELCPFVSGDGKYFFYTSRWDIYWVDAKILNDLR